MTRNSYSWIYGSQENYFFDHYDHTAGHTHVNGKKFCVIISASADR
jgi:hypothetical protein